MSVKELNLIMLVVVEHLQSAQNNQHQVPDDQLKIAVDSMKKLDKKAIQHSFYIIIEAPIPVLTVGVVPETVIWALHVLGRTPGYEFVVFATPGYICIL